jgi:polysaccharide deacetylase 2 family uncharacterized protein YibQ
MAGWEGPTRSSFRTIAVLMLIPVVAVVGYAGYVAFRPASQPVAKAAAIRPASLSVRPSPVRAPSSERHPAAASAPRGRILLIIDDIGFEGQHLDEIMSIDKDINFSVLPNATHSREYATRLHDRGFEVLCHLPMEPVGNASPGRDAILTSMSDAEITQTVRAHLDAVPYARGMNNHMGSRATADRRVMAGVLGALPESMYFIDSRTGGGSVAASMARSMKRRAAVRDVFLDDEPHRSVVRQQLALLAQLAQKQGTAVGIGHPHAATLSVLREEIPRLRREGFQFVRGSEAVN